VKAGKQRRVSVQTRLISPSRGPRSRIEIAALDQTTTKGGP